MLLKQARMVYWKTWAAKHECKELEGRSLAGADPGFAAKENQCTVDRQAPQCDVEVVEGGWVQKRMYDIFWSDVEKCRGCTKGQGTEKRRLYQLSVLEASQTPDLIGFW